MTPLQLNREYLRLNKSKKLQVKSNNTLATVKNICSLLNIEFADIKGQCRKRNLVMAKYIIANELRNKNITLERIGNILHRHHASIIYYLKQYEILKEIKDKEFLKLLNKLK